MQAVLLHLDLVVHFFFQSGDDNEELNQGLNVNIDQNYGNGDLDMDIEPGFEGKCENNINNTGLLRLCGFFQQVIHYFLVNYAPKIFNYVNCPILCNIVK